MTALLRHSETEERGKRSAYTMHGLAACRVHRFGEGIGVLATFVDSPDGFPVRSSTADNAPLPSRDVYCAKAVLGDFATSEIPENRHAHRLPCTLAVMDSRWCTGRKNRIVRRLVQAPDTVRDHRWFFTYMAALRNNATPAPSSGTCSLVHRGWFVRKR